MIQGARIRTIRVIGDKKVSIDVPNSYFVILTKLGLIFDSTTIHDSSIELKRGRYQISMLSKNQKFNFIHISEFGINEMVITLDFNISEDTIRSARILGDYDQDDLGFFKEFKVGLSKLEKTFRNSNMSMHAKMLDAVFRKRVTELATSIAHDYALKNFSLDIQFIEG